MTSSVSNNAYGIICDAMVDAGILQEGDRPNSEQLVTNMRRLNDVINLWQTQGLKLFLQEDVSVPLVKDQYQYKIGPTGDVVMARPPRILQGWVTDTTNVRRPLTLISKNEWNTLSQITGNSGPINSFMVDKQPTYTGLNLWPAPDSLEVQNTATFMMQVQASNPLKLTDDVSFPQEWRIALRWGLADDICTGQPMEIQNRCLQKATMYRKALQDWDVEEAPTYFEMDTRFYQETGRFR